MQKSFKMAAVTAALATAGFIAGCDQPSHQADHDPSDQSYSETYRGHADTSFGNSFNWASIIEGAAGLLTVAAIGAKSFYTVETQSQVLLTRFGKYVGTDKEPGPHMKSPFTSVYDRVPTAQQTLPTESRVLTSDGLFVNVPLRVPYHVVDAKKFSIDNVKAVENVASLVDQSVRAHLNGKKLTELYSGNISAFSDPITQDVAQHVEQYGVEVGNIIMGNPAASEEAEKRIQNVTMSELAKQAAKNDSDAEFIRDVRKAEADKERDRLRGEGAALYRKAIFDQYNAQLDELVKGGTSREEALDVMKRFAFNDTLREVGDKGNMVIVTPDGNNVGQTMATQIAANHNAKPKAPAVTLS